MTTNKNKKPLNLRVYGKPMKQVTEFIYLGHKLSSTNDGSVAVQNRIGLGWAAFVENKHILTSNRVPYQTKAKIYNTYILPVLYGLDCVNWTKTLLNKIETFQNHIMRFILEITCLTRIIPLIKSKTLKLFGHIKHRSVQNV